MLSLHSIPQTSSVVPVAPWERVIKFGELLSWNSSYLPGNWKWVSVMWKECGKVSVGWGRHANGRLGVGWGVCVSTARLSGRQGQCQRRLSVPLDFSAVMAIGVPPPLGTAALSSQPKLTLLHTVLWDSILALKVLGLFNFFFLSWDAEAPPILHSCALVWGNLFFWNITTTPFCTCMTYCIQHFTWHPLWPQYNDNKVMPWGNVHFFF